MTNLDAAFRDRIVRVFGDEGRAWLDRLPRIVDRYAERWQLQIEPPLHLSYNYVAPAVRADGTAAIFKCGVVADNSSIRSEIAALRHWNADGAVLVLEADIDSGAFLIERLIPGQEIVDEASTRIAAGLMRRLWRPLPDDHSFPTVADWGEAFALLRTRHDGTSGPLPKGAFDRGESLYFELVASQAEPMVLHGDLHHLNILSAEREPWLVIDPHGVVGEAAFEVGAWLRNPVADPGERYEGRSLLRQPNVRGILARRLDTFADELGLDRLRLRDWGIAFATLSASWSDESGHVESWQQALTVAEHLSAL